MMVTGRLEVAMAKPHNLVGTTDNLTRSSVVGGPVARTMY